MYRSKLFIFLSILFGIIVILIAYFSLALTGVIRTSVKEIIITSSSDSKTYDGTPLKCENIEYDESYLYDGDYIVVEYSGFQINAGVSDNTFVANIYDSFNNNVTSNYNIIYVYGKLEVDKSIIRLNATDITKEYDGKSLSIDKTFEITNSSFSNSYITSVDGNIVSGDTIYLTESGKASIAGVKEDINFSYVVRNADNDDITSNYDIIINNGSDNPYLEIEQIDLTIKTESKSLVYNGEEFKYEDNSTEGYEITSGSLDDGDIVEVQYLNSIKNVGSINNEVSLVIRDSKGNDVTDKYNITYDIGTIVMNKASVYVWYNKTIAYSGKEEELSINDVSFKCQNYDFDTIKGLDGTITYADTIDTTLPGIHNINIDITSLINSNDENIIDNFVFIPIGEVDSTLVGAYLEITPIPVTITLNSLDAVIYSGGSYESKVTSAFDITNELRSTLLTGHTASVTYLESGNTADFTNAGEHLYIPTITIYDNSGNDVTSYYDFNFINSNNNTVNGIYLTIDKYDLILVSESVREEYDSNDVPLSCKKIDYTLPSDLDKDNITISCSNFATISSIGSTSNTYDLVDIVLNDGDSKTSILGNFNITVLYGILELYETEESIIISPRVTLYTKNQSSYTNSDLDDSNPVSLVITSSAKTKYSISCNSTNKIYSKLVGTSKISTIGTYTIKALVSDIKQDNIENYITIYETSDSTKTNLAQELYNKITFENGILSLYEDKLTFTDSYKVKTSYNGTSYTFAPEISYEARYGTDLTNYTFEYSYSDVVYDSTTKTFKSYSDAGTYINSYSVKVYNSDGTDVTSNFSIICKPGYIVIAKQNIGEITSVSTSSTNADDYEKLIYNEITYTKDEFIKYINETYNEDIEITFKIDSGNQNKFVITFKTGNYKCTYTYGVISS